MYLSIPFKEIAHQHGTAIIRKREARAGRWAVRTEDGTVGRGAGAINESV